MTPEIKEALLRGASSAPSWLRVSSRSIGTGIMLIIVGEGADEGASLIVKADYAPSVRDPRRGRSLARHMRLASLGEHPPAPPCVWQLTPFQGSAYLLSAARDKAIRRWAARTAREYTGRRGWPHWFLQAVKDLEAGQLGLEDMAVLSRRPPRELALWHLVQAANEMPPAPRAACVEAISELGLALYGERPLRAR